MEAYMEIKKQYEEQYCENDPVDEVWILADDELTQIKGDETDDDYKEGQ